MVVNTTLLHSMGRLLSSQTSHSTSILNWRHCSTCGLPRLGNNQGTDSRGDAKRLQRKASDPVDIVMHGFIVNRYFFGDFSSVTSGVSDNTFEELNHPIGQLYLAGEAYIKGLHSNTHGALIHGSSVAEIIAREIQGPLTNKYYCCLSVCMMQ